MDVPMCPDEALDNLEVARRIEIRMSQLKTNAAAVSRVAKIGSTAVHDILSRKNKKPSAVALDAIARALNCDLAYLIGRQDWVRAPENVLDQIPVEGIVEAGAYRPMPEINRDIERTIINAPRSGAYARYRHFAYLVWGDSMDAARPVPILQGMYVLCVDMMETDLSIEGDKIYVVRKSNDKGKTFETTVKRARVYKDRIEFVPESHNAVHEKIVVPLDFENDMKKFYVAGWVYGAFTPLDN
jgi:SOS-response transcriptional repressor LexA